MFDEVAQEFTWKNINVPKILSISKKVEDVKNEKNKVVKSQKLRGSFSPRRRKRLQEELQKAKQSGKKRAASALLIEKKI
jgi:ATP-dependent Clp protease ATP-binding subunit ClpC